ncbi:MAG: Gldg family protein [Clostridia bacterium]|nr:Gldg family protein [Clostridia bacterium]
MKMKNLKSLAESRKVKYGTINIAFIALVIAIVIMVNSIITVLSNKFNWYFDMTEEQLYTVSDELVTLLDTASGDMPIDIIFCVDKDKVKSNYFEAETGTGSALAYIHSTATQIEQRLDNVTVLYKDYLREHAFFKNNFNKQSDTIKPNESTVIIARREADGSYGTMYRVYHATSFYTFDNSAGDGSRTLYGYSGERTFASAILSLMHDKVPTVYFVAGHGETIPYSTADGDYNIPEIASVFMDCGFGVRYIFLTDSQFTCKTPSCGMTWGFKEVNKLKSFTCDCGIEYRLDEIEFNEKRTIPSDARAVIINNPKSDYIGAETGELMRYIKEQHGTVMCFVDPVGEEVAKHPLPELQVFLESQMGIVLNDTAFVTDSTTHTQGNAYDFKGTVASNAAGSAYLSALQNFGAVQPTLNKSGIFEIDGKFTGEEGVSDRYLDRKTLSILQTSKNAEFGDKDGVFNVMSVTAFTDTENNQNVNSYFVFCPSASFVSDEYLADEGLHANRKVLLALIHSTTSAQVPVDLDFKPFADYRISISSSQATTVFVCLVTILPVLVIGAGMFIIIRRKHR